MLIYIYIYVQLRFLVCQGILSFQIRAKIESETTFCEGSCTFQDCTFSVLLEVIDRFLL